MQPYSLTNARATHTAPSGRFVIGEYISADPKPKPYFVIFERESNGVYWNWTGIYSTLEGAKRELSTVLIAEVARATWAKKP